VAEKMEEIQVQADADKEVKQILRYNLIGNCAKRLPDKGSISDSG